MLFLFLFFFSLSLTLTTSVLDPVGDSMIYKSMRVYVK